MAGRVEVGVIVPEGGSDEKIDSLHVEAKDATLVENLLDQDLGVCPECFPSEFKLALDDVFRSRHSREDESGLELWASAGKKRRLSAEAGGLRLRLRRWMR